MRYLPPSISEDSMIVPRVSFVPYHSDRDNNSEGTSYFIDRLLGDHDIKKDHDIKVVLELGCGRGSFIDGIRDYRERHPEIPNGLAFGIDMRDVFAYDKSRNRFLIGDAAHIPVKSGTIDLVRERLMFSEFYDLSNQEDGGIGPDEKIKEILSEVRRVLRDGGYFLTSISYRENPSTGDMDTAKGQKSILSILKEMVFVPKCRIGFDFVEPEPAYLDHVLFQKV